jgi:adenylate kinase
MATLAIVGGASGVGKTTLLRGSTSLPIINTGTLFKNAMDIANRDEIRSTDWSCFEEAVSDSLAEWILNALSESSEGLIVDTHFAAKLRGSKYRIGLRSGLLSRIASEVVRFANDKNLHLSFRIILIRCDPHSLLGRRRLDVTRQRELIPSDCYNDLRSNWSKSFDYNSAISRALRQIKGSDVHEVKYSLIDNISKEVGIDTLKLALL